MSHRILACDLPFSVYPPTHPHPHPHPHPIAILISPSLSLSHTLMAELSFLTKVDKDLSFTNKEYLYLSLPFFFSHFLPNSLCDCIRDCTRVSRWMLKKSLCYKASRGLNIVNN